MSRLWVKVIRDHRIDRQQTAPCDWGDDQTALRDILKSMDIPMPIRLPKHESEFDQYRRTAFLPDHFMEDVDFQRLEIEFLEDSDKKRVNQDPRNQF